MSREKSEERLTDLVGHAMCGGDFQPLSDELAAMRSVAVKIAQTSDDPSVGLLAAIVADLSYVVGSAMAPEVKRYLDQCEESQSDVIEDAIRRTKAFREWKSNSGK